MARFWYSLHRSDTEATSGIDTAIKYSSCITCIEMLIMCAKDKSTILDINNS